MMADSVDPDDIPGRPAYVNRFMPLGRPVPATAVRATTPERERERRTARPRTATVYLPGPEMSPEMRYAARCLAYAYITPADAPRKADPAPFIRAAVGAALPDLWFELVAPSVSTRVLPDPDQGIEVTTFTPSHGADRVVRFPTPEDREAAVARQPFTLGGGGGAASVALVREGETPDVRRVRLETLAHVALRGYPRELRRSAGDVRDACAGFGHLLEVDLACLAAGAPDMAPVRAVLRLEHAREIPREVRVRWGGGAFRHVVPVQILRVWDRAESLDADGEYVPVYGADALVGN